MTGKVFRSGVLALLLSSLACAGSPLPEPAGPASDSLSVGLRPGDAVRVRIWQEPDLSGEFPVSRAGKVVFPLLGEKDVLGVSAEEAQARLTSEYREYLENPSVEVTVLRRIAILGEVRQPSLYMVDPTVTLTDALALAGGISPSGDKNDIRLVREGKVVLQELDSEQILGTTEIQSGDEIIVGQQGWVKQNLTLITAGLGAVTSIVVAVILASGY